MPASSRWALIRRVKVKHASLIVLSIIAMSGLLLWIVRSAVIAQIIAGVLYHRLWLIFIKRHWWSL